LLCWLLFRDGEGVLVIRQAHFEFSPVDMLEFLSNPRGMSKSLIDWDLIDRLAEKQGVEYWARRKWRQRQHVPHKWRLVIIMASRGRIKPWDFAEMDRNNGGNAA
jgi:hypothetical protein